MAAGLLGSFALTRLLSSLLFSTRARDPVAFGAVAVLLGVVAMLATWIPARRAARLDPTASIRCE